MWHNGNKGDLFLFGSYCISPLVEILELYKSARTSMDKDWYQVSDDSGVFKDCITNTKWIQFANNGGNTIVFLDMDPANQGTEGQILESCDGDIECNFSGIKKFISDINDSISKGELAWDDEAGSFWETDEKSAAEQERFTGKLNLVDGSPTFNKLQLLHADDNATLVGAVKPNHKTQKHQLFIKGGSIWVNGEIGETYTALAGSPPLVKIKMNIEYKINVGLSTDEFIDLLRRSTLGERRPVDDRECMEGMIENSNLIVTAWNDVKPIGIARSMTDFHYACYLSDLAVDKNYQNKGIGRNLQIKTQEQLGPKCKLILVAAPSANSYYEHIGFTNNQRCWILDRKQSINS